jgi:hypothetical protein
MKHAREDYNRIQDPENKIPEDEPVFLLRAQDVTAPDVLEYWAELNDDKFGDKALIRRTLLHAAAMREWQRQHGSKLADF